MPFYQATNGSLHYLDDERFEHILSPGCEQISYEDAIELQKQKIVTISNQGQENDN